MLLLHKIFCCIQDIVTRTRSELIFLDKSIAQKRKGFAIIPNIICASSYLVLAVIGIYKWKFHKYGFVAIFGWEYIPMTNGIRFADDVSTIMKDFMIMYPFFCFFMQRMSWYKCFGSFVCLISSISIIQVMKVIIYRTRPDLSDNNSFPSGHAGSCISALVVIFFFLKNKDFLFFLIPCFFVFFARIYAQKHFLSDIIGGTLIGTILTFLFIRLYISISYLSIKSKK